MYTRAGTVDEAVSAAGEFRAGGTDLQERLHSGVSGGPLIDIQRLPDLGAIEIGPDGTRIGALATVAAVGRHPALQRAYPALTLPAQTLATPQIRSMATIGGVLCQRTRCWYYRHPELSCPKKDPATSCPARDGNHHFGVCFDFGPCVHPHPSSIGCSLLTYDAEIDVRGRGRMSVVDLFGDGRDPTRDHVLNPGELITHVLLPPPIPGERASYQRLMSRAWAEWPLVEVATRLVIEDGTIGVARIGIGGVANIPFRLHEVEEALTGQPATSETLERAALRAAERADPLPGTAYKVEMVTGLVLTALESATAAEIGAGGVDFAV